MGRHIEIILGLPHLRRGPLLERACELGATVLISANALSRWRREDGVRLWSDWDLRPLRLAHGMSLTLDSAGFVAMAKYRGFGWTAERYVLDLATAFPFRWFASMDLCVEPEIAPDRDAVLDRIAGTANLNMLCHRLARDAGIADRLMPVIQGWRPDEYRRCLDLVPVDGAPLIGVGSMCRRHLAGETGIIACVEAIARHLGDHPARLHLFGLKGPAAAALRRHPRIASLDSQAYGVRARRVAYEQGISKTDTFLADMMERWYAKLSDRLDAPGWQRRKAPKRMNGAGVTFMTEVDFRIAAAREELRNLVATSELNHTDFSPHWIQAMIADDDEG